MGNRSKLSHLLGKAPKASETDDDKEKDEEDASAETDDDKEKDEEEASAETDDDKDDDEKDDDKSAKIGKRIDAAFALLKSPEAKGRDKLATELAEAVAHGEMTSARAKSILAAAPKGRGLLQESMDGKDMNVGPSGDTAKRSGEREKGAAWAARLKGKKAA